MITKEDMLARLMKGEDAEAIAKEMTDALNAAIVEAKKAEEEKAKREAEKKREGQLDNLAAEIVKLMKTYIEIKAPEVLEGHEKELIDVKSFRDTIDGALKMITILGDSMSKLEDLFETPKTEKVGGITKAKGKAEATVMTEEEAEKILEAFCKNGFIC
jgi:hypothetical protein